MDTADDAAVERLAQLDSGDRPTGHLIGAEIEGRLLVATSIETGKSVADPFSRTEELRALVEMRIAQIKGRASTARGAFGRALPLARSAGRLTPRRRRQAPHSPVRLS